MRFRKSIILGMVSGNQARKVHKRSSKVPSLGSKRNHGVKKQASNSLKYMIKRMNARDSLLMKSFIRREVRDEVERKFQELLISREKINEAGKSGVRSLELCFINDNKLPITAFTKTNIIPNDEPLQVALIDVRSKSIVKDGPFSSIKIQICPIHGEFESCEDEDWTENEFNDNIVHERDNKEPLLVGDRVVTLKNGIGSISEIMFTDNSGWVRNKKFRLGAKAMKNGENVKEGRSQAFRVKDIREEFYKKHYPPFLNDDVWRLKLISKTGPFHKRLRNNEIHTVKDILRLLIINESSLHEIFGKIPKKCWSDIIEHARSCVVDEYMLYAYEMIGQPILLLFNVIYELNLVEIVKQDAYKNIGNLKAIDEAVLNSISLEACIKSTQKHDMQHIDVSAENVNDDGMQNVEINNLVEIVKKDAYKKIENLRAIDEAVLNSKSLEACIKSTQDLQDFVEPFISTSNVNNGMQNVEMNVDPGADIREIGQNIYDDLDGYLDEGECSTFVDLLNYVSNIGKPKAVWCKIRAVVKWGIIVRRVAAARRNEPLSIYQVYDISAIF